MNPKSLMPSLIIIILSIISSCGDNYQPESYPFSEVTIKDSIYYHNNKKIEYGNIFILEKNSDSTVLEIIGGELNYKKRYNKGEKEDFTEEWYWTFGTVKKSYKNGKANGPSEEYDENGILKSKGSYLNDEKDGIWEEYDKNGNLSGRITYVNNKKNGPHITFLDDGRISYVYTFKNDKREGLYESFDKNNINEFVVRSMYKNDKEDGVKEYYGRYNVIYMTETYRNGIKIDSNRPDRSVRINSIYPNESVYFKLNGSNNNSQSSGGVYTYESGYRRMKITISSEKWFGWLEDGSGDGNYSGKTTIGGKMNGSDLYDEYGTEKRGYVSGNTIYYNDPLGEIKLSK